jgi:hypothetical protein
MNLSRTLGWLGSGALLVAVAFAAAGCSNAKGQWPDSRLKKQHIPTDRGPIAYAPDVEQAQYNMQAMNGLPAGVQASFLRDHPDAAITSVQQVPSGTGLMFYRVAYLEDGLGGVMMYRSSGVDLDPPPTIIRRGDDYGRPPVKYAPSTQPAQAKYQEIVEPAVH